MKRIFQTTTLIAAAAMLTTGTANANGYDAHQKCKQGEDNRQVIGGLIGAVAGGVLGSQVSGNGARTEGSAIGAVIGGLAGAGIADKSIDCDPVYTQGAAHTNGTVYSNGTGHSGGTVHSNSGQLAGGYSGGTTQSGYPTSNSHHTTTTVHPTYHSSGHISSSPPPVVYEDQVTVSNHPVYSNPTYGANVNSYGTTYSTGTVTYPPSGHNTQYQTHHSVPSTHTPSHAPIVTHTPIPQSYVAPPTSLHVAYVEPVPSYRPRRKHKKRRARFNSGYGSHFHGQYSCNMHH